MTEHEPPRGAKVLDRGSFDSENAQHRQMLSVQQSVEQHGEMHASFRGIEDEVELRVGTLRVNYREETYDVWDGDNYQRFSAEALDYAYKPMAVFHEG